jgi:hypothetical protein
MTHFFLVFLPGYMLALRADMRDIIAHRLQNSEQKSCAKKYHLVAKPL